MKGIQGLIIAVFLGVLGAVVNMYYLYKGRDTEVVTFVGVKPGARIERGKPIRAEQLEPVSIPRPNVGNLSKYAYIIPSGRRISDEKAILGWKPVREYSGGELILLEDLRTPQPYLELKDNEAAVWITINTSTTIVSQIIPGVTPISFYLPKSRGHIVGQPAAGANANQWEWVGPFEILSVGNRMGEVDVLSANRVSAKQQNVVTLRVTKDQTGQMDPKVVDLYNYWHSTNYEPLAVMLHPPKTAGDD